jgi:hypothetical protein
MQDPLRMYSSVDAIGGFAGAVEGCSEVGSFVVVLQQANPAHQGIPPCGCNPGLLASLISHQVN